MAQRRGVSEVQLPQLPEAQVVEFGSFLPGEMVISLDFMVILMDFYGFLWGFQWQLLVSGPGKKSGDFMGKFKH